ncbi:MAG: diacylglycerol kinase family protein [Bacteroidota bacterium]|nr:diacylglycerol kinase family protein [Bacteroidota bacterium]
MKKGKFSIQHRIHSFSNAFRGIYLVVCDEHNAWIQIAAAICAVVAGILLKITPGEWTAVVISAGFVLALEMANTAIERLADFVSPERQDLIKTVKDISAGAVLTGAITALVVGLIIFLPKIIHVIF